MVNEVRKHGSVTEQYQLVIEESFQFNSKVRFEKDEISNVRVCSAVHRI